MTPGTGLVTRGMGAKNLLVVRGMISFEHEVIAIAEEALRRLPRGRRPKDDRYLDKEYDVLISARVLEINNVEPPFPIKGVVRVSFRNSDPPRVQIIEHVARTVSDKIVIRVKRVSGRKKRHGKD